MEKFFFLQDITPFLFKIIKDQNHRVATRKYDTDSSWKVGLFPALIFCAFKFLGYLNLLKNISQ